jgi:hypothetical protein
MTIYVGCTIYFWGEREQNRLLASFVRPLAERLRAEGACGRFLCFRFDARGPHIMALFGVTSEARDAVAGHIAGAVAEYLSLSPSKASLSEAELDARHAACRGCALCSVDRDPGLAANNSYAIFDHTDRHYPFNLADGAAEADALWSLREDVVLWALGRLSASSGGSATGAAVRWLACVDGALQSAGEPAAAHFRDLAGRLIPGLKDLKGANEPTAPRLLSMIGAKNCEAFSRLWSAADAHADSGSDLAHIIRITLADDGRPLERRKELLYDLVHTTLLLLGVMTQQQAPLLLFAWASALERDPSGVSP